MKRNQIFGLLALGLALTAPALLGAAEGLYRPLKEIPVGDPSSWDYLSVDEAGRRLYVSHGTEVVVIDIDKDTVVGKIANTPRVHGFAIAPDLGRGRRQQWRREQRQRGGPEDAGNHQSSWTLDTNPDGMLYEPGQHEVYLFNGGSASATVINVKDAKVVATVPLGGKPEFGAADPAAGRVYDNLEDKSAVVVIDTKTHAVVATWPITGGTEPSGLAIDTAHHRLFIGCGGNNKMVMMDSTTGKVITTRAHWRGRGCHRL